MPCLRKQSRCFKSFPKAHRHAAVAHGMASGFGVQGLVEQMHGMESSGSDSQAPRGLFPFSLLMSQNTWADQPFLLALVSQLPIPFP